MFKHRLTHASGYITVKGCSTISLHRHQRMSGLADDELIAYFKGSTSLDFNSDGSSLLKESKSDKAAGFDSIQFDENDEVCFYWSRERGVAGIIVDWQATERRYESIQEADTVELSISAKHKVDPSTLLIHEHNPLADKVICQKPGSRPFSQPQEENSPSKEEASNSDWSSLLSSEAFRASVSGLIKE